MPTRIAFLLLGLCSALTFPMSATSEEDLGTIQVESSTIDDRFDAKREEPSTVSIISGEAVDAAHVENIQQVLQKIPGITTEVQSGDSLKIHIRGVENQRFMGEKPGVAVVIDGVPVFERTGRVNIDLDNIESVKVIKGGASYLFGEDALSGAIIITTKRGARQAGYRLLGEYGSFDYWKGLARAGYRGENSNGHIQISRRESDGYHFDSDYRADYLNGKWQYYLDEASDLTFGFELSDRDKDSHGAVTGVTQAEEDPESIEGRDYARMFDVRLAKYYATYSRDFTETNNVMVNVYQFTDDTDFISAPQRYDASGSAVTDPDAYNTENNYFQRQRGVKSEYRAGGEKFAWLAAVDVRANSYENQTHYITDFKTSRFSPVVYTSGTVTGDNVTDETVKAAYGEIKFKPVEKLTLSLNGRHDLIELDYREHLNDLELERDFNVNSWRAGANFSLSPKLDIYGNVSTGFRTPTVEQLFAGDIDPLGDTASNPDLEPEVAVNREIGLRGLASLFGEAIDYELAVFQIERDDFILATAGQYSLPNDSTNQYQNIGGTRNRGLELSLQTNPARRFSFGFAYTYLDAEFTRYENFNLILGSRYVPDPTIESYNLTGNQVPRVPRHHANLTMKTLVTSNLIFSAEVDSISDYYADELNLVKIDGHSVLNFLLNYDVKLESSKWSWFARVDNVLDERYYNTARGHYDANEDGVFDEEDTSIVVNPGRVWTAGVAVAL